MKKKAIVLLSGGLDSAATLYLAKSRGFECFCLIFDYGQRHGKEVKLARGIAKLADCKYKVLKIDLPWKGSSLIDKTLKVPQKRSFKNIFSGIPSTYVPSRNTIFLSYAASFAESIGAKKVFIGANAIDFSGYPDCRPGYFRQFNKTIKIGTKSKNITVAAPLINKTKSQIIILGSTFGIPFKMTWSCYSGRRRPCGNCDSCRIRAKGFKEAGIKDSL